ncbi:hypothetical protein [Bradyrhizobium sp. ISRA463]|uniref:hypothetical protein n=1 Tax=Bradyrhizobium sp. ISRA463 TaxID=2866199 RepID=UPI00247A4184|nr:hypothetical protein [Bradyrhizobium sp. ISRA463]WGS19237.1 hypothetical protein MTX22_33185 [Bradyrhizobium sp. ISRA463]
MRIDHADWPRLQLKPVDQRAQQGMFEDLRMIACVKLVTVVHLMYANFALAALDPMSVR